MVGFIVDVDKIDLDFCTVFHLLPCDILIKN